jgi:photosystem II stability/assembly factor-like uncharacterized protein
MNRLVSIVILICIVGLAFPQARRRQKRGKDTKAAPSSKAKRTAAASRSTVGLDFRFVTPDRNGGVWIGGTAWLFRGLMVNDHEGRVKAITVPEVKDVSDLRFVTPDIGWMTDSRSLYRTLDAGNSWQRVEIPRQRGIRTLFFSDIQNGWAGGWTGQVYHTTDAGQTWNEQRTGLDYQIQELRFVDPLHGWAVGFICYADLKRMAALLKTSDGGATWQILSNEDADSRRGVHSVVFLNEHEGWALDNWQYNIVHTVDGGKTWTMQQRREEHGWNSLFFINNREGWAAGDDGIVHTSDGGETWESQLDYKPGEDYLDAIAFADSKHGWAIGMNGALRTTDGGATWRSMPDNWKDSIPSFQMLLKERSFKDVSKRQ